MTENNQNELFDIRINEDGKKWIARFEQISYTMLVLVLFEAAISLFVGLRALIYYRSVFAGIYGVIYPYTSILFALLALVSNFYYLRFPRQLLRSIKIGDEYGANQAFKTLLRAGWLFLIYLILSSITILLSFTNRELINLTE